MAGLDWAGLQVLKESGKEAFFVSPIVLSFPSGRVLYLLQIDRSIDGSDFWLSLRTSIRNHEHCCWTLAPTLGIPCPVLFFTLG